MAAKTKKQPAINTRRNLVPRLNIVLRFLGEDLALLSNGAWEEKLGELYLFLFGTKRDRTKLTHFDRIATRESVREAQLGLLEVLGHPRRPEKRHFTTFLGLESGPQTIAHGAKEISLGLGKQQLHIAEREDGTFHSWFTTEHFPTMMYMAFNSALQFVGFKRSDLLSCADENCQRLFIPLRRPHKGESNYCSPKCSNRIAAMEYRKRKGEELKAGERARSHAQYIKRQQKKHPGKKLKVKRIPRKPK